MRGYFGVGVERISKAMNMGSIFRTAHAFGAGFVFTAAARYEQTEGRLADTSSAPQNIPFYAFPDLASMVLPSDCMLVGIELTDESIELPSFRHPRQAAYVLGPERGALSAGMTEKCEFVVKIPTKFCVNVGIAAAIVMYDRQINLGRFPPRPIMPGGPTEDLPDHVHGDPKIRNAAKRFLAFPPDDVPEID